MKTKDKALKEGIAKILNLEQKEEMSTNDLMALLLQVSLVLLIIFVMANVLFRGKAKAEIGAAKDIVGELQRELDDLKNTTLGKERGLRQEALIDLQKQRLLKGLAEFEATQRIKYGFGTFTRKNEEGETVYVMDGLFSGSRITDKRFQDACRFAKKELPYRNALIKNWCSSVLLMEGMSLNDSPVEKAITKHPETLTKDNEIWLLKEIDKRIKALHTDSCNMQCRALAMLQSYYQDNTSALKGTEVYGLVKEYLSAPPERKGMLIREIRDKLYEHSKSVFEKQEVPLLNEV